jgi:hypothetical protein
MRPTLLRALVLSAASLTTLAATHASAQTWSLAPRPTLSIGSEDTGPEYLFNRVEQVRQLGNGRILVTMGPDIRYFDAAGKYVGKAGGRGQGPGEFQYIQDLITLPGDTLLVLNFRNKVWLTADGKYIRQELVKVDPLMEGGWFSEGAFLLPNGNLLAHQYAQEQPGSVPTGLHRPVLRFTILDLRANAITPLITAGGLRQITDGRGGGGVQAFSPHAQNAIGADRIYVGDNDTTFISAFTLDGKPQGTITVAEKAVPVTAQALDAYRKATLDAIGNNAQRRAQFERGSNEVPKPKRFPYWGTALVDKAGNLWVSAPMTGYSSPLEWSVFNRAGRRIASITMPAGFTPKDIGADYVLGVARDDNGVESVRKYSLAKRAR